MTALSGSYVSMKTMADGTVRVTIDLDCTLSELGALNLMPGTPLAIARLTNEAGTAAIQPQPEPEPAPEPPKGGALARLAGMWCNDQDFQGWMSIISAREVNAEEAARIVRNLCKVKSRAELDNDEHAAMRFQELIRLPYMAYCQGRTK